MRYAKIIEVKDFDACYTIFFAKGSQVFPMREQEEKICSLLNNADCDGVVAFFQNMPEKNRRDLAPVVTEWIQKNKKRIEKIDNEKWEAAPNQARTPMFPFMFAYFATVSLSELKSSAGRALFDRMYLRHRGSDNFLEVIRQRQSEWFTDWLSYRMATGQHANDWLEYLDCFRKGLCSRIINEPAVFCMFRRFSECADPKRSPDTGSPKSRHSLFGKLYPEFLDEEIFYPFEHEFTNPFPFGGIDLMIGYPDEHKGKLRKAFLALFRDKLIRRDRFLDATLNSLSFRYKDGELRWYAELHRELEPTPEEIAERQSKYIALLESANSAVSGVAFDMLVSAAKSGTIAPSVFLQETLPLFRQKNKGRCMELLSMGMEFVASDHSVSEVACYSALAGMSHMASDVQSKAALLFIAAYPHTDNRELFQELKAVLPTLKAAVQKKLEVLFPGTADGEKPEKPANVKPKGNFEATSKTAPKETPVTSRRLPKLFDTSWCTEADTLVPVTSVTELVDLAIRVAAAPTNSDEIELLLDGISRIDCQKDPDWDMLISPLRSQCSNPPTLSVLNYVFSYRAFKFGDWLSVLFIWWCSKTSQVCLGEQGTLSDDEWSCKINDECETVQKPAYIKKRLVTLFGLLITYILWRRQHGIYLQLLSTPTHRHGWIDPVILVERIKNDPGKLSHHDEYDKILSLYRIAPDRRTEAAKLLGRYLPNDAYVNAVRFILNAKKADAIETISSPWRQACKLDLELRGSGHDSEKERVPWTVLEKQEGEPSLKPDEWYFPMTLAPIPYGRSHYENRWVQGYFMWCGNILPSCRDYFYQTATWHLLTDIDYATAYPPPEEFLTPLLDPRMPIPEVAVQMLMEALAVKQENVASLAQDVILSAIADGRLDAPVLVAACRYWLTTKLPGKAPATVHQPYLPPIPASEKQEMVIGLPKFLRWAKRFETLAAASSQAAEAVWQMLQVIVPLAPKKDVGTFCELLYELCLTRKKQIESEECRTFLAELKGSGKAAKLAKAMLNGKEMSNIK